MSTGEDRGVCACGGCGARFRRLSTFDRHRAGGWSDRRCLTSVAMLGLGFTQDSNGLWRAPPKGPPRLWPTRASTRVSSCQTASHRY